MQMFSLKSLRMKSVLAGLVPFALILAAAAVIGSHAYDQVARDVVRKRDSELARVTAARLADGLQQQALVLQRVGATPAIRSLQAVLIHNLLAEEQDQLFVFDGGVLVYGADGYALASEPRRLAAPSLWFRFPDPGQLEALSDSLRPQFSRVLTVPSTGERVIFIAVPILGSRGEFRGAVAGMLTLKYSLLGTLFADVLEIQAGRTGFAYLVDGRGRVIYHRDATQVGTDLSELSPVAQVISGRNDAVIADDTSGTEVIAGFAPVEGTGWGVVTQDRWSGIIGPIRGYGQLLLGLLALGGLVSAGFVFFAIGRTLQPIQSLTRGAQRIASGDFDRPIDTDTDDELRELAEQFNTMATELRTSYADLEARVEARTEENRALYLEAERRAEQIAAVNLRTVAVADVSSKVASILSTGELLPYVADLLHETFGYDMVAILLVHRDRGDLVARAAAGFPSGTPGEVRQDVGDGIAGWVAQHNEPLLVNDVAREPQYMSVDFAPTTRAELAVPIAIGDDLLGVLDLQSTTAGAFDETDQFTAQTLANQLAVAIENARLFRQAGEVAVLEERNRLAREMHDTLAQGFTGIVLQLEAAEQVHDHGVEEHDHTEEDEELREHLSRAKDLARDSLQEARRSVWALLPKALEERPLDGALEEEVRRFAEEGGERATFNVLGESRALPSDLQSALLRICQESLTNARRHAGASEITVELAFEQESVRLLVRDNGSGFDIESAGAAARERGGGLGISGMEQRAALLQGSLTLKPSDGGGTLVEASFPAP